MTGAREDRFQVDLRGASLMGGLYLVGEPLSGADGGMATVYHATNTNLGTPAVVKVPDAALLARRGFRERFQQEIEFLKRFDHPHVVRILAAGEHDQVPYLVLAWLAGRSLKQRLAEAGGRQAPGDVLAWLAPLAETLDHLHARGVVHRDVKPGNILFHEVGTPYLSDFGIAKVLVGSGSQTVTGLRLYTPAYAAPEQVTDDVGGAVLDGRADQYALAATVYEALAGAPPFTGSQSQIEVAKLRDPVPDLRARAPHLLPATSAVVSRALAREPSARFPSCAAFARAFAASLTPPAPPRRERTRTAPPPPRPPPPPPPRRGLAVALLLLLAAGLVAVLVLRGGASSISPPPPVLVALEAPLEGALVAQRAVRVAGRVSGSLDRVQVNGQEVPVAAGAFAVSVTAPDDGPFLVRVIGGTSGPVERHVEVDSLPPALEVLAPAQAAAVVTEAEYVVRGTARDAHLREVRVNGAPARVGADGAFAHPVAVPEGGSVRVALEAADAAGHTTSAVRTLSREASWRGLLRQAEAAVAESDLAAAAGLLDLAVQAGAPTKDVPAALTAAVTAWKADPVLVLLEPADGAEVTDATVRVRGTLTTGRRTDRVLVNGRAADLSGGAFSLEIPLTLDEDTAITVWVVDGAAGARRSPDSRRNVRRTDPEGWLLRELRGTDADRRLGAVLALGDIRTARPDALRALLAAQADPDPRVALAAVEALDDLRPSPLVADRTEFPATYENDASDGSKLEEPQRREWLRVECNSERQVECWLIAAIPAKYVAAGGRRYSGPPRRLWRSRDGTVPPPGTEPIALRSYLPWEVSAEAGQPRTPSGPLPDWARVGVPECATLAGEDLESGEEADLRKRRIRWREDWS